MKILRTILLLIIAFFAILFLWAYSYDQDYNVEREVTINKPISEVFEYAKYLKNQDDYTVWQKADPNTIKTYTGTDGTVGFVSKWESEHPEVGVGEQEIKKIIEGKRIETELRFLKPFEDTSQSYMTTEAVNDSTTLVKWGFDGHMDPPMNLIMLKFGKLGDQLGAQFSEGLSNMKTNLETRKTIVEEVIEE